MSNAAKAPILGLVLAGGVGRRMAGAHKPFEELADRPLIDWAIATGQAQCAATAISLHDSTPDAQAPFAQAPFAAQGLPLLADALPGRVGPLAGVLAGLDYAARKNFSAVLSLPCDCPFLPGDLAARLFTAAEATADGLACAASGGRAHHVVALWPTRLRDDLRRALMVEDLRKVGQFQQRYDIARVEWTCAPFDPFFNVNTPGDLAQARAWIAAGLAGAEP